MKDDAAKWWQTTYRCQDCKTRFVGPSIAWDEMRFAHCPGCRRMDLNQWSGKTFKPEGITALKIFFGANRWRCEYCRLNFASFRKRHEIFSFRRWQRMKVGNAVREGRARVAEQEDRAELARELAEKRSPVGLSDSDDDETE
jgi:DNA-directed RNA polymerase subunit RPC12/RpoP